MNNTIDYENVTQLEDLERVLYAQGQIEVSNLLGKIIEMQATIDELQYKLDDLPSVAQMNQDAKDLQHLKEFFYSCFDRLGSVYPCPEFYSDYDKSIIYEAIEKGDAA